MPRAGYGRELETRLGKPVLDSDIGDHSLRWHVLRPTRQTGRRTTIAAADSTAVSWRSALISTATAKSAITNCHVNEC